ncbi:protein translocase subunit SecDF, partial [bacterium]|nr:protein translocase subunit SecDF [bacterium]
WRFEFAFGVGALAAALHDALILISVASIFRFEVDTAFVAAMLTILGYSINDTVVIFDRIRDNLIAARKAGRGFDFLSVVNNSIYETFGRTINTVVTVLLVLISLLIFGGGTMRAFVEVLFVGVLVGTYSSIFIASPWMVIAYREPVAPVTEQKSVSAKR